MWGPEWNSKNAAALRGRRFKASISMNVVPVFQCRKDERGKWMVAIKWPSGLTEDVTGFATESLANEWIVQKLRTLLRQSKPHPIEA
jgi:hypothetical protein